MATLVKTMLRTDWHNRTYRKKTPPQEKKTAKKTAPKKATAQKRAAKTAAAKIIFILSVISLLLY